MGPPTRRWTRTATSWPASVATTAAGWSPGGDAGGTVSVKGTTARVRGGTVTVVAVPKLIQEPAPEVAGAAAVAGRTARAPSAVL